MTTVLYPAFTHCQSLLTDSFWSDTFYLCACGRFPAGFEYDHSSNTVIYEGESIALSNDPSEIIKVLKPLFQRAGLKSYYDLLIIDEDDAREIAEDWKSVKPKRVKDRLISDYITDMCVKLELNKHTTKAVWASINVAFKMKVLVSNDIVFEDGKVRDIANVDITKEGRVKFTRKPQRCTKEDKPKQSRKIERYVDRYVKALEMSLI